MSAWDTQPFEKLPLTQKICPWLLHQVLTKKAKRMEAAAAGEKDEPHLHLVAYRT